MIKNVVILILILICICLYIFTGNKHSTGVSGANNEVKKYQTTINELELHVGALNDSIFNLNKVINKKDIDIVKLRQEKKYVNKDKYINTPNDSLSNELSRVIREIIKGGKD